MKVVFTKDLNISHDGINLTAYKKGDRCDLMDIDASRVIELGAAQLDGTTKTPVVENKKEEPVVEDKVEEPKEEKKAAPKKKATKKKGKK